MPPRGPGSRASAAERRPPKRSTRLGLREPARPQPRSIRWIDHTRADMTRGPCPRVAHKGGARDPYRSVVSTHAATSGIALLAFIVSVVSLAWNIALGVLRWPRLGVVQGKDVNAIVGVGVSYRFRVTVINAGSEAATITDVGMWSTDRSRTLSAELLQREGSTAVIGKGLPCRIDAHDSLTWAFEDELLRVIPAGEQLEGYARRFRRFHRCRPRALPYRTYLTGRPGAVR